MKKEEPGEQKAMAMTREEYLELQLLPIALFYGMEPDPVKSYERMQELLGKYHMIKKEYL